MVLRGGKQLLDAVQTVTENMTLYKGVMFADDVLADERGAASAPEALYALGLMSRTATGQVYSFASYVQWLRSSGLSAIERHELGGRPPLSVVDGIYSL